MKRILAASLSAVLLASTALAAPKIGEPAPDFTAMTASGETVSLSDYEGRPVVLEWTNDGCPFVQKHYDSGNMQTLQKRAAEDGVTWLSVVSSAEGKQGYADAGRANQLTEERGAAPAEVVLDASGEVGALYAAKTTPHMFVVDGEGVLRYAGAIDTIPSTDVGDVARADDYVTAALESIEAGEPVTVTQTTPYGCSVKY